MTAEWRHDQRIVTLGRYTLAAEDPELEDIVLDGTAVLAPCDDELHDPMLTVPGME